MVSTQELVFKIVWLLFFLSQILKNVQKIWSNNLNYICFYTLYCRTVCQFSLTRVPMFGPFRPKIGSACDTFKKLFVANIYSVGWVIKSDIIASRFDQMFRVCARQFHQGYNLHKSIDLTTPCCCYPIAIVGYIEKWIINYL